MWQLAWRDAGDTGQTDEEEDPCYEHDEPPGETLQTQLQVARRELKREHALRSETIELLMTIGRSMENALVANQLQNMHVCEDAHGPSHAATPTHEDDDDDEDVGDEGKDETNKQQPVHLETNDATRSFRESPI